MPSWKKVIVSGSDASFNSLYVLGGATSDGGFTGSLFGTASHAISASYAPGAGTAISASYALSASYASTASYALAIPDQGFQYCSATSSNTWIIGHNLDTLTPLVNVYDSSNHQIIPSEIIALDANTVEIDFSVPRIGCAIISKGSGVSAPTSSFAVSASYSISASYAENVRTVCYTATASSTTWTIPHNFGCKYVIVNVYNGSDDAIIPNRINLTDSNTTTIYFTVPTSGTALLIPANCCGGTTTTTTSTTSTTTTVPPTTTTSTTTSTTTEAYYYYVARKFDCEDACAPILPELVARSSTSLSVANGFYYKVDSFTYQLETVITPAPITFDVDLDGAPSDADCGVSCGLTTTTTSTTTSTTTVTPTTTSTTTAPPTTTSTTTSTTTALPTTTTSTTTSTTTAEPTTTTSTTTSTTTATPTTTTSTTTSTTTAANFFNTIGFGGATEDACGFAASGAVTGDNPVFCNCTTLTGSIFAAAPGGTWYVSFGGQVVQVAVINGNPVATVESSCSSC